MTSAETAPPSAVCPTELVNQAERSPPRVSNHQEVEKKCGISNEEITAIMEVIASTGKFWHDWDMLKNILSFRLKQVLAEYPESQVACSPLAQQNYFSGETYSEIVTRLDEELLSFMDGPPFTLQRLCEILLAPKSMYKNLSKLALALEKNLLVTTTMSICVDPYPTTLVQKPVDSDKRTEEPLAGASLLPNGDEAIAGDGDEEMTDAEADEECYCKNLDTEMTEENDRESSVSTGTVDSSAPPETQHHE